jgi:hypothetical protein
LICSFGRRAFGNSKFRRRRCQSNGTKGRLRGAIARGYIISNDSEMPIPGLCECVAKYRMQAATPYAFSMTRKILLPASNRDALKCFNWICVYSARSRQNFFLHNLEF